jgi:hypothetical protein
MSFFFDEFVDQNGNDITIDTTAITKEIKQSPLFQNSSYATGNTQFEDAVMRAEFYPPFNKDGDNDGDDNYHVLLGTPQTLTPVTIEVPVGSSEVFVDPNGTFFALIDINFIVSQLNTLTQTEGISVQTIPIFLTRNAVYGDFLNGTPVDCSLADSIRRMKPTAPQTRSLCRPLRSRLHSTPMSPTLSSGTPGSLPTSMRFRMSWGRRSMILL